MDEQESGTRGGPSNINTIGGLSSSSLLMGFHLSTYIFPCRTWLRLILAGGSPCSHGGKGATGAGGSGP